MVEKRQGGCTAGCNGSKVCRSEPAKSIRFSLTKATNEWRKHPSQVEETGHTISLGQLHLWLSYSVRANLAVHFVPPGLDTFVDVTPPDDVFEASSFSVKTECDLAALAALFKILAKYQLMPWNSRGIPFSFALRHWGRIRENLHWEYPGVCECMLVWLVLSMSNKVTSGLELSSFICVAATCLWCRPCARENMTNHPNHTYVIPLVHARNKGDSTVPKVSQEWNLPIEFTSPSPCST